MEFASSSYKTPPRARKAVLTCPGAPKRKKIPHMEIAYAGLVGHARRLEMPVPDAIAIAIALPSIDAPAPAASLPTIDAPAPAASLPIIDAPRVTRSTRSTRARIVLPPAPGFYSQKRMREEEEASEKLRKGFR